MEPDVDYIFARDDELEPLLYIKSAQKVNEANSRAQISKQAHRGSKLMNTARSSRPHDQRLSSKNTE